MDNWKEEVELLFEEFRNGYVVESEMREQIDEWGGDSIPELELEEVCVMMEHLIAEVEEVAWEKELVMAYEVYDGENKEYVS